MWSIFSLDKRSPEAHYLQWEVGDTSSLKVIPESRTSAIEFFSFLSSQHAIASCSGLAYSQSCINHYTTSLAAGEVGFCRVSPGVGSRGCGHGMISGYSCLLAPLTGAISAHGSDLTGRVTTAAMAEKPNTFCCTDIALINRRDMTYIIRSRKEKHSKPNVRTPYYI